MSGQLVRSPAYCEINHLAVPDFCTYFAQPKDLPMRIGYARVSAQHQNLDRQLATLRAAGVKRIFKEKQLGREVAKRPHHLDDRSR
jgi:hypothetical protein